MMMMRRQIARHLHQSLRTRPGSAGSEKDDKKGSRPFWLFCACTG